MAYWPENLRIKPIVAWPGEPTSWTHRQRSPFRTAWSTTLDLLSKELRIISAREVILQVDIEERWFRIDGYPRANAVQKGPGVILTFDAFKTTLSYPCDTYDDWQDNVRAVALALEALRKVDRYGVTKRGEQYQGFKALPPGSIAIGSTMTFAQAAKSLVTLAGLDYWDEGVLRKVRNDKDFRAETYRKAAKRVHPDMTDGDESLFKTLSDAATILDKGPLIGDD